MSKCPFKDSAAASRKLDEGKLFIKDNQGNFLRMKFASQLEGEIITGKFYVTGNDGQSVKATAEEAFKMLQAGATVNVYLDKE